MSTKLTAKFRGYYPIGNYTRTRNKDSRGVIHINVNLRDASYRGVEMIVVKGDYGYYTHRVIECPNFPEVVGEYVNENFLEFIIPVEIRKIKKVWGE